MAWEYTKQIFGREFRAGRNNNALRVYQCLSDADIEDLSEVLANPALPVRGEVYDTDSAGAILIVVDREVVEVERELRLYEVNIYYATPRDWDNDSEYPWDRDWEIDWDKTTVRRVLEKSLVDTTDVEPTRGTEADTPVRNSAQDVYDPSVMHNLIVPVVTLTKSYQSLAGVGGIDTLLDAIDTCNDADDTEVAGKTGEKWQWLIQDCKVTRSTFGDNQYYTVTWVLAFNELYWYASVLDAGYNRLVLGESSGEDTERDKIRVHGVEVSSPFPLDGAGQPLDLGSDPIYTVYGDRELTDFSVFGFPTDF